MAIDRLPANEAYSYIDMIYVGTDIDVDNLVEKAMEQRIDNETDNSYDIRGFM